MRIMGDRNWKIIFRSLLGGMSSRVLVFTGGGRPSFGLRH